MKTILVTGGAGFIGSNFVRHVLECRDYRIINLDKLTYAGNSENLRDIEDHKNYNFVKGDIADRGFMRQLFEAQKPDAVINFAAETHVDRSIEDSLPFMDTNIMGTHVLLELAREFGLEKYHQVSTDEVYGDLGDPEVFLATTQEGLETSSSRKSRNFRDKRAGYARVRENFASDEEMRRLSGLPYFREDTPINPNCPYAAAKASADLLVDSWHETYGLHTVITRCSNNYGPYQFPEKLIPFFLFRAMNNEALPVYGDGKNIRDWLYVLDHCEAILLAFEKSPAGEVWNIGGHNEKTNLEIVEQIKTHVPETKSEIEFVADRKAHDRRYAMDASKLERELGWKPAHTFEQALPKTIEWYLANREWVEAARAKV